jgi:hypothetical protein
LRPGNTHAIPEELALYRRHSGQMSKDWQAMRREHAGMLEKLRLLDPELASAAAASAVGNMSRYWAFLAYERCQFPEACRLLLRDGFRCAPRGFPTEIRNRKLGAACLAGLLLPNRVDRGLERPAGYRR